MNLLCCIRKKQAKKFTLKTFGVDLIELAAKRDTVIGRDEEIDSVERILLKISSKRIPLLTGKCPISVVEGLAQRIARGNMLKNYRLIALDTDAFLAAGGDFVSLFKEVEKIDVKVILFIDRIHLFIEAGRVRFPMCDLLPLKAMLSTYQLWCIGATTPEEYNKYVDKDAAEFLKMFQRVFVADSRVHDVMSIAPDMKLKDEAGIPGSTVANGFPITVGDVKNYERLAGLADELHKRVVGQYQAVEVLARCLRCSSAVNHWKPRSFGTFLLLGPTGVGKSELAKALAEKLFGSEDHLLRFDASMYVEPRPFGDAVVRQMREAARHRQHMVLLFEELEKATQPVLNAIRNIMEEGILRDNENRVTRFSNIVIIMSSNLGAEHLLAGYSGKTTMETAKDLVIQELQKSFYRPELFIIVDEILFFDPLTHDQLKKIARLQLNGALAKKSGVALEVTDAALDYAFPHKADQVYDAWPVRKWVENTVLTELSKLLPHGEELGDNSTIYIDAAEGEEGLSYHVENN